MRPLWTVCLLALATAPALAKDRLPDPEDMQGKKELGMMHCPSAVAGSRTIVENIKDGVVVSVTSNNPVDRAEILRRAKRQEEVVLQPERGALEHTGLGTGSGRYGHCPGMLEYTTIDLEESSDGVRMIIRAEYADDVERLQKSARARLRALRKTMAPKNK
jgi:hypothetical protein